MKTEIINPEKLLAQIKLPVISNRFPECCSNIKPNGIVHVCNYQDDMDDYCNLFGESLELTDLGFRYERCQKCLDNFKLIDE